VKPKKNVSLAPLTTFKIGGPAEYLLEAASVDELVEAVVWARKRRLPVTILGGGSNILISDQGIKGLVIANRAHYWQTVEGKASKPRQTQTGKARICLPGEKVRFADLYYKEEGPVVKVRADSGTHLGGFIGELLLEGITGLQWFVGIPGTVGGAVFNNIHAGHLFLGQLVDRVEILDKKNQRKLVTKKDCQFGYDCSRFQKNEEIILRVDFVLKQGDAARAREFIVPWLTYRGWRYPVPSAGCIFKNLDEETQRRLGFPTPSWGYIIDKVLGLKGRRMGGAKIADTHSAFIVNEDNKATAKDVLALIELVRKKSKEKLGVEPKLEIFIFGEGESK